MRSLYFHSGQNSVSEVRYGLSQSEGREDGLNGVDIVLIQSSSFRFGLSLINSDEARVDVVSRIFDFEVRNIPLSLIRVFHILDFEHALNGTEFLIDADMQDYVEKGNPAHVEEKRNLLGLGKVKERVITTHSFDVVAGSCKIVSDFSRRRHLDRSKTLQLMDSVHYNPLSSAGFTESLVL